LRIVAGKYRRRKLKSNPGLVTRPIPDRVKELLFERLGGELHGERVADVFAGTGTIGLEALSRGASTVVFFERDRKAAELLDDNLKMLDCKADAYCWRTDVCRTSFRPKGLDHMYPYDLVFFDPPYKIVPDVSAGRPLFKAIQRLSNDSVTSGSATLIFRVPKGASFTMPEQWVMERQIPVSTMDIFVYRKAGFEGEAEQPSQNRINLNGRYVVGQQPSE
jgi:16S rRNA (guanine966-N2)-methyltransferase